jgi:urease accessory protein
MFALGLWSALTARRVWLAPLAFALMLLAGATLGRIGVPLPAVEPAIAASVLVLGLLVALRWRLPGWGAVLMAGTFALFHGHAHGLELSGPAQGFALLGLLIATVGLHLGGIAVGRELPARAPWLPRLAGAALALFGAVLLGAFA